MTKPDGDEKAGLRRDFVRGNDRVDLWWVPASAAVANAWKACLRWFGRSLDPIENGIYFIDGAAEPATLNLFDSTNRRITRVATLSGYPGAWGPGLNVSNDGHTVLYGQGDEGDIMLIEGFR